MYIGHICICICIGGAYDSKRLQIRGICKLVQDGSSFVCLFACIGPFSLSLSIVRCCVLGECIFGVGSLKMKMNQLCGRPENKHWKRQSYALQTYLCLCTSGWKQRKIHFAEKKAYTRILYKLYVNIHGTRAPHTNKRARAHAHAHTLIHALGHLNQNEIVV